VAGWSHGTEAKRHKHASSHSDDLCCCTAQAQPEYLCVNAPRDTCPGQAGADVFRNILDYPPDACMDRLTTGQATRMAVGWNAYRWV
jgi:hypothetical protein